MTVKIITIKFVIKLIAKRSAHLNQSRLYFKSVPLDHQVYEFLCNKYMFSCDKYHK